jgi:UDP-glucose 4-epimerase
VGADVPFTVNELARIVAAAMQTECRTVHLEPRHEVKIAFSDHNKAERVFGKRQKVSLEEGIRRMTDWVHRHGARESCIFDGIEIPRNLPPSWQVARRNEEFLDRVPKGHQLPEPRPVRELA